MAELSQTNFGPGSTAKPGISSSTDGTTGVNIIAGEVDICVSGLLVQSYKSPTAASGQQIVKNTKTGIVDATLTDILTVTVPNGTVQATIEVDFDAGLGAGGAVGAGESVRGGRYKIIIARVVGVNAAITISAVAEAQIATVAGGATLTATITLSAVAGAVGAVNTFTVQTTLTKSGGASAAHVEAFTATLLNAYASGASMVAA